MKGRTIFRSELDRLAKQHFGFGELTFIDARQRSLVAPFCAGDLLADAVVFSQLSAPFIHSPHRYQHAAERVPRLLIGRIGIHSLFQKARGGTEFSPLLIGPSKNGISGAQPRIIVYSDDQVIYGRPWLSLFLIKPAKGKMCARVLGLNA